MVRNTPTSAQTQSNRTRTLSFIPDLFCLPFHPLRPLPSIPFGVCCCGLPMRRPHLTPPAPAPSNTLPRSYKEAQEEQVEKYRRNAPTDDSADRARQLRIESKRRRKCVACAVAIPTAPFVPSPSPAPAPLPVVTVLSCPKHTPKWSGSS